MTAVGTDKERDGSFWSGPPISSDKPVSGLIAASSSDATWEAIQEGDGGMKVLRAEPGAKSLWGSGAGV